MCCLPRKRRGKIRPKGARVECTAYFDNSAVNNENPDPKKEVRWGDQTWEEMMIGWMYVSIDLRMRSSGLVQEKDSVPTGN